MNRRVARTWPRNWGAKAGTSGDCWKSVAVQPHRFQSTTSRPKTLSKPVLRRLASQPMPIRTGSARNPVPKRRRGRSRPSRLESKSWTGGISNRCRGCNPRHHNLRRGRSWSRSTAEFEGQQLPLSGGRGSKPLWIAGCSGSAVLFSPQRMAACPAAGQASKLWPWLAHRQGDSP